MDFDAVADELYGLAPEQFTTVRTERAKQARAEGDRTLAEQIGSLRRPAVAAWLTNQLVRDHADELEILLDLGRELREVLADIEGDELRELTKQRYQLVSALVQQARSLAATRGRRVTDAVTQAVRTTLEATLSDEASARLVAAGRLTEPLAVSGFAVAEDGGAPVRLPGRPHPSASATVSDLGAQRQRRERMQAERDVDLAERAAERARRAAERAAQQLQSAQQRRADAAASVDRLQEDLRRALADLEERAGQERAAGDEADEAERQLVEANERLAATRARHQDLQAHNAEG